MSDAVLPTAVTDLAGLVSPAGDEVIERMEARAREESFPTVGPEVGAWLAMLVRMTDATRVFEFGSGFGYSAYWMARALPPDGSIVLTEIDEAELDSAREYFRDGDLTPLATFEHGDAIEIVDRHDGPFDVVLIDNEKHRYVEALEAVRPKLEPGSLVIADNAVTAGDVVDREEVRALLVGKRVPEAADGSRGIAEYLAHVGEAEDLQTALLPLGEGLAVSLVLE